MLNPRDYMLRQDRIPHIWCSGCGIGTTVGCFISAIEDLELDTDKLAVVSGIGCTGRVAGYLMVDSFHTTHGRAIPFATGLKLARPELRVVVISGDGDLAAIGGNHLIHAARRNIDLTVICVNNFNYAMTGGQAGPTTHPTAKTTTTPYGAFEHPFALPALAVASGAVYASRWTVYHVQRLRRSIRDALSKPGFTFIEAVSPCPTNYGRRNKLGAALDEMKYYKEKSVIKNEASMEELGLGLGDEIICGNFWDRPRPTFLESLQEQLEQVQAEAA